MGRSKEQLEALLKDVKTWYHAEFGIDYDARFVKPLVEELITERARKFVFKRLGHLPANDLISLVDVITVDAAPKKVSKGE